MFSSDKKIFHYPHMIMTSKFLIFRNFDYKYTEFLKGIKNNYYDLLKILLASCSKTDKRRIVRIGCRYDELHPLAIALKNARSYSTDDPRICNEISIQEKNENEKAVNIVYLLMDLYKCDGRQFVDSVKKSYSSRNVSKWLNLSDLHYDPEMYGNQIINKKMNFEYILDNFEECTGELLIAPEFQEDHPEWHKFIIAIIEHRKKCKLTNEELGQLYDKIVKVNEEYSNEKRLETDSILEEWLEFVDNLQRPS